MWPREEKGSRRNAVRFQPEFVGVCEKWHGGGEYDGRNGEWTFIIADPTRCARNSINNLRKH